MRVIARSLVVAFIALLGAIGLAVAWTTTTAIQLLATTAFIMGGTDHPLVGPKDSPSFVTDYLDKAVTLYIDPSSAAAGNGTAGSVDKVVAVYTPEEFFPLFGSLPFNQSVEIGRQNLHTCLDGSDDCIHNEDPLVDPNVPVAYPPAVDDDLVVFGYSQSAVVASLVKQDLIDNYVPGHQTSFVMAANPMRPNGGMLMRGIMIPSIPFFGITFYGATPTDSEVDDNGTPLDPTDDTYAYPTVDYAQQYDGLGGDFPYRPFNLLATFNALAGYALLHGGVVNKSSDEALFQGKHGDTSYYMFPTELVPVLMPLQMIGVPKPILSFFDEFARVLIEDAYLRDVNPGEPTAASLLPFGNPITLALKLLAAIPVAIDNVLEDLGVGRALGTTASGPFGVGGPPLPEPPTALNTTTVSTLAESTEVVEDNVESVEPEALSLGSEDTQEPTTEPEPTAEPTEEPGPVEPETPKTEEVETTTPEPNETPSATDPDRPEVRGPIEFDSQQPQPNSPSNDPDNANDTDTTPEPEPAAESENDDADAAA